MPKRPAISPIIGILPTTAVNGAVDIKTGFRKLVIKPMIAFISNSGSSG
jgi:hypothetical protein